MDGRHHWDCDQKRCSARALKNLAFNWRSSSMTSHAANGRLRAGFHHFIVHLDCGAAVPQRDRLRRVEWPLSAAERKPGQPISYHQL
jgi:hypothetical protein